MSEGGGRPERDPGPLNPSSPHPRRRPRAAVGSPRLFLPVGRIAVSRTMTDRFVSNKLSVKLVNPRYVVSGS